MQNSDRENLRRNHTAEESLRENTVLLSRDDLYWGEVYAPPSYEGYLVWFIEMSYTSLQGRSAYNRPQANRNSEPANRQLLKPAQ